MTARTLAVILLALAMLVSPHLTLILSAAVIAVTIAALVSRIAGVVAETGWSMAPHQRTA